MRNGSMLHQQYSLAAHNGKAVKVETSTSPGNKRLKLKCDILLSTSAFKSNLRRYNKNVARLRSAVSVFERQSGKLQTAHARLTAFRNRNLAAGRPADLGPILPSCPALGILAVQEKPPTPSPLLTRWGPSATLHPRRGCLR